MDGCVVVGSGPAGLSAALYLIINGIPVTVIERLSDSGFGRYHSVCGAGISDAAFRELELIDPTDIRNRIDRTKLKFPGGVTITMKTKGYVLDRVAFLRRLRERCESAGCAFVDSEVIGAERIDGGFRIRTRSGDFESRYVIGCDGAHSVIRRDLFGSRPLMMSAEEFIVDEPTDDVFRIFVGERYHGLYEWRFPSGTMSNVGSGKGMIHPDDCISKGGRNIPYGGVPKISDGDAYICGDAAGMANPVSGGGLRAAMVAGQNAAREIVTGKDGYYQRWWDGCIMSSRRFLRFRRILETWGDSEFMKASRPFRNGRDPRIWGPIAGILHPKYIPMYIGALKTFGHTW